MEWPREMTSLRKGGAECNVADAVCNVASADKDCSCATKHQSNCDDTQEWKKQEL